MCINIGIGMKTKHNEYV